MVIKKLLIGALFICTAAWVSSVEAGDLRIINQTIQEVKVASIGGQGRVPAQEEATISFKNDENGADINIWWVKNARQLCQIYTPWDRTILITGKYTIQCLSKK